MQWHCQNVNLFGSVGEEGELVIWDLRTNKSQHLVYTKSEVFAVLTVINIICIIVVVIHMFKGLLFKGS